ncbi:MAG: sigma-70 family RNA polymerase sigma factor [Planctomycetes bacterium]|nr:sigma-70 family RNA polymerase sigma factor [Planctomycetota bacterium]
MSNDSRSAANDSGEEMLVEAVRFVRQSAQRLLRGARTPTLQPTELVNEAFARLLERVPGCRPEEEHLRALLATIVRQVLVDHLRARNARKRGGDRERVPLSDSLSITHGGQVDAQEVHDALCALAEIDERAARVVELRFFGGLTVAEVARVNGCSERTVAHDWRYAQAWLRDRLTGGRS